MNAWILTLSGQGSFRGVIDGGNEGGEGGAEIAFLVTLVTAAREARSNIFQMGFL